MSSIQRIYVPATAPFVLQERRVVDGDVHVMRAFDHQTAACAVRELELLNRYQSHLYTGGDLQLVVIGPDGAVIAHSGTPADLLPEWSVLDTSPQRDVRSTSALNGVVHA